ncbi:orotate phosphoribosyltransferase [uncultured Gimesia sp.]|uniref:orotate phosphoribosyltransferase n=1 Tax=uncultured Gimesia sp. TaxID=1678688 RepID=UPI0030D7B481|tara:strand:- start:2221 stop:2748 length:528 start_codon:yes stop_codon:yes gene_type:complete
MSNRSQLATQIKNCAQLSGTFTLRSGVTSDTYFDKYLFESDPVLLKQIAEAMADLLPENTEVLAGLEMGGIPVVSLLSQVTGLPAAFIRKEAKTYGTCKFAEGIELTGKNVVLVEDVVSSGGAILDALTKLRSSGIEPVCAVCVIDRQTGGAEALQAENLELRSVLTMQDIADIA